MTGKVVIKATVSSDNSIGKFIKKNMCL